MVRADLRWVNRFVPDDRNNEFGPGHVEKVLQWRQLEAGYMDAAGVKHEYWAKWEDVPVGYEKTDPD